MRAILVTRAAEDAARTRAKLEARGYRVLVSPLIEIVASGPGWPTGMVDAVLATSGQAFAVMDGWGFPSFEARRLMPLYLVGERTADIARRHGFVGPRVVAANVAMLALAIGKLAVVPKRLLYLAGKDRKPDIETALEIIGCRPDVLEIYEARAVGALEPNTVAALAEHGVAAVLHFSRRSASLFRDAAKAASIDVRALRHLCLSGDVAAPLADAGCLDIHIAEAPNEAALLALVEAA